MIRVVLDTNVVVSALISPFGNEAQVVAAALKGRIIPCFSGEILKEYTEVLARPKFGFSPQIVEGLIASLRSCGMLVAAQPAHKSSPDPDDDAVIACALTADAHFIVTGNKRHFPRDRYGQAQILSAREMLEALERETQR